jgi:hypothetical protein
LGGIPWYFDTYVTCLTRGSRDAIATTVEEVGNYVWSIEVAEVDWNVGKAAWKVGTHLFSVMLLAAGGHQSGVIATVLIDKNVKKIKPALEEAARLAGGDASRRGSPE